MEGMNKMNLPEFTVTVKTDYRIEVFVRWVALLKRKQSHYCPPYDIEWDIYSTKIKTIQEIIKHILVVK